MHSSVPTAMLLRFDCFEVDVASGEIRKRGHRIHVREQSFQVLIALLERPGQVVTREELRERLWRDQVFVDFENNLNAVVARLRQALCDTADRPRFIETLHKRGYRFLALVEEVAPVSAALISRARLVVLPFLNLTGDPQQEYLSDAVTDEMITALAGLFPDHLAVIARTTAMHYKGTTKDVAQIARDLRIDYVVEAGLRRTADRVSLNVQLIRARDEIHLFAARYDTTLDGIFARQTAIAQAIAARIPVCQKPLRIAGFGPAAARKAPTHNADALSEYMQGRQCMETSTADGFRNAKLHFERAIQLDPDFAHAFDGLAENYWYLGYLGFLRPKQAFSAGIVHALRALEIDNSRAETHALLGQFHKIAEYNWEEVEREMAIASRLDPNSPVVRLRYAVSALMPHGHLEQAVAELDRALEVDPLSITARSWLGIMLVLWKRYPRAVEEAHKLLELSPKNYPAYFALGLAYRYQGKIDDSIAAFRLALEYSGGAASVIGWLGALLASVGQTAEARALLDELYARAAHSWVPPCSLAWIHLGLKELDRAFEWMDKAVEECDQLLMPIKNYGIIDPIRSDPRVASILRRMRLEP